MNLAELGVRADALFCDASCRSRYHREHKLKEARGRPGSLSGERGYFDALDAKRGYQLEWCPRTGKQVIIAETEQILARYAGHLPLTVRQIYYRLIAEFGHPKSAAFEEATYDALEMARRARMINFEDVRDDGIQGGGYWPSDPDEILDDWRHEAERFQRDRQEGQDIRIEVWCEAGGMVPQLERVCDPYGIPVYSCGGFSSLTAIRQTVAHCLGNRPAKTVVLHFGDCDPAGYSIFQAIHEDVPAFLEVDAPGEDLFELERVALTLEQMEALKERGLQPSRITTKDHRTQAWAKQGLYYKQELEALAPDQIAALLTEAIERHLDSDIAEQIREEEDEQRELLAKGARAAWIAFRVEAAIRSQLSQQTDTSQGF